VPLSLANPVLLDLWTYWRARRAGRLAPFFTDIDLEALGALARNVLIVEKDGGGRYRYGIVGSSIRSIYGYAMEGLYLDRALPPDRIQPAVARYALACDTGQPLLARSVYSVSLRLGYFVDRLILPLANPDGAIGGALSGQIMRSGVDGATLTPSMTATRPDDEQLVFLDDTTQGTR
jgi:hypothetical protein